MRARRPDLIRELVWWVLMVTGVSVVFAIWGGLGFDHAATLIISASVSFACGWQARHRPRWPSPLLDAEDAP